jgi:NAD(P)-dependent dehydrogenase (short-subunit alcohol dehydrogenase family)
MKVVVITGSTRGIGYGLADSFLSLGCSVVVSGRTQAAVNQAVSQLGTKYDHALVFGAPCDITVQEQVQELWNTAKNHYGKVDIWINNAGIAHPQIESWQYPPDLVHQVVNTNIIGTINGSSVAMREMLGQGFGSIYNIEGYGSNGRSMTMGLSLYGLTKAGLRFFNDTFMKEAEKTPVIIGAIQPGMVYTDMIKGQYRDSPKEFERVKGIFNIIAERPETVTPWIAKRILANDKNGVRIAYGSSLKIFGRFLTARFRPRQVVE